MANTAASTGAIRPKNTSPLIYPDGTKTSIVWVKEQTVIKRIRRKLAERGHYLQITRAGTDARTELGEYCVLDDRFVPLTTDCKLPELARFLGVLADDERLDPKPNKGWMYHIARQTTVTVEGVACIYNEQITKDFTTEKAARKAAEGIDDREGLVICSWDASNRKGGKDNA